MESPKTITESSNVCPTEDAIRALLETLVDPLLPLKPSPSDVPSKDLRESVAKQVHAVVLLYNYYHRREHPNLEYLSFESFRTLTTVMRPVLLQHLKESSQRDGDETVLLHKVIVDACSLSMSLDALDLSSLTNWPIRKVAVLLVDSQKKNCYLQHSSITQGVWSLLEKPIEKEKTAAQYHNKEVIFQKLAFAAIKEATGVKHNDIVILERHLIYSLSEEKTAIRFYIMKCGSQDKFSEEIPIEDALECMQGPLFEKSFSEWAIKPIVEYFHVLPYAKAIADWFSRREDTESVIEKEAEAVCDDIESNGIEDEEPDVFEIHRKRGYDTNAKKYAATLSNLGTRRKATPRIQNRIQNGTSPYKGSYSNGEKGGSEFEFGSKYNRERCSSQRKAFANSTLKLNAASVSAHNSNLNIDELQTALLSRATSLSETAMKVLLCKRDKLTLQQRNIEDEIAKCDKYIKNIKGDWELQLETILECCNETYPKRTLEEYHENSAYQSNKRRKLHCQKLDDICLEKNWVLPNYRVSSSDGGFEAEVRINGHLANTIYGEEKSDAEEARESAAACLLNKLYRNATSNFT